MERSWNVMLRQPKDGGAKRATRSAKQP